MSKLDTGQLQLRINEIKQRVLRKGASSEETMEACNVALCLIDEIKRLQTSNETRLKVISYFMDKGPFEVFEDKNESD